MAGVRGLIVAVSANGVIGLDGDIPWRHDGDLKRFKEVTRGATVIMGRHTWESLPRKPLPKRRNVVVTSRELPDADHESVVCVTSIAAALELCDADEDVWFIGGARIYAEAMDVANIIDMTFVPDVIEGDGVVRFPDIPEGWTCTEEVVHEYNPKLLRARFRR